MERLTLLMQDLAEKCPDPMAAIKPEAIAALELLFTVDPLTLVALNLLPPEEVKVEDAELSPAAPAARTRKPPQKKRQTPRQLKAQRARNLLRRVRRKQLRSKPLPQRPSRPPLKPRHKSRAPLKAARSQR